MVTFMPLVPMASLATCTIMDEPRWSIFSMWRSLESETTSVTYRYAFFSKPVLTKALEMPGSTFSILPL